jgi:Na+/proline symporter
MSETWILIAILALIAMIICGLFWLFSKDETSDGYLIGGAAVWVLGAFVLVICTFRISGIDSVTTDKGIFALSNPANAAILITLGVCYVLGCIFRFVVRRNRRR